MANDYPFQAYDCPTRVACDDLNDCAVIAVSTLFRMSHAEAKNGLFALGRNHRCGTSYSRIITPLLEHVGATKHDFSETRLTVRMLSERFPSGWHWLQFRDHCAALIDGVLVDTAPEFKGRRVAHVWELPATATGHVFWKYVEAM